MKKNEREKENKQEGTYTFLVMDSRPSSPHREDMHMVDHTTNIMEAMSTRISQIESTLQSILKHICSSKKDEAILKSEILGMELDALGEHQTPKAPSESVVVREVRWKLKDLRSPQYHGSTSTRTADTFEQWLSEWEHCFCLCHIVDDMHKIGQATYNTMDVAYMWCCKIEQEKKDPTTLEQLKILFYNSFVPPNERSRALHTSFFIG
ncbi:hypothetical protein KP509_19G000900 [Ceratopteris richardii]|uniref:Uncharacterized protein n=1 Tax=Ceratopteris richardii TaxID=49495 RepID=A0A8T2SKK3_CERRI|nr:hypothetical protein KP509_19G000900 [Ceratopteris richardii]